MSRDFTPLSFRTLEGSIPFFRPTQALPMRVDMDSPAVDVMTDLRQNCAVTAMLTTSIDNALERMIKRAVRLLLVVDNEAKVVGLITARDIQGEKPIKLAQKLRSVPQDLLVADLMTLQPKLEVLPYREVLQSKVGHIIATLRHSGRQHTLVVDADDDGTEAVRGIFSLSQIGKQLGLDLDNASRATTFAELEKALGGQPED